MDTTFLHISYINSAFLRNVIPLSTILKIMEFPYQGHFGYFQVGAITNKGSMNIHVQVFV